MLAFDTYASNLAPGDTNARSDVYVYDSEGFLPDPPTIFGFEPGSGPVGTLVTMSGINFFEATAVTFNGISQPLFVVNPAGTQLTTVVPIDAVTGQVSVTTPSGSGASTNNFNVTPSQPTYRVTGQLLDTLGDPIYGAVIRGGDVTAASDETVSYTHLLLAPLHCAWGCQLSPDLDDICHLCAK